MPAHELLLQLRSDEEDEIFDAITDIRKQRLRSLATAVVPFLTHTCTQVRGAAARAIGDLGLMEHEPAIRGLALADPDQEVRQGAIYGWSSLLSGTRMPAAMTLLVQWLRDPESPYPVRCAAFWGLLDVGALPVARWPAPRAFSDVDRDVPWELVDDVVAGRLD